MYVKDELEDKIESVKNNLNTVKKNLEEKHGDDKSLFAKHLNKIQESINEAKFLEALEAQVEYDGL